LKLEDARKQQGELTRLVSSILDDNGVPQNLKDKMNTTSSAGIYWLTENDVLALGEHPPWYEELLIAKCNYEKLQKFWRQFLGEELTSDNDNTVLDKLLAARVEFGKCEDKIVNDELSILASSLASKDAPIKEKTVYRRKFD
jgi:hypothetical protein